MTYDQLDQLKSILDECQILTSFAQILSEADESTEFDYAVSKLTLIGEQCDRIELKIERFGRD